MVAFRRGGFTLIEAIISLTLTSVLMVLVSTVFLVQNQYYAVQLERAAAQDNVRMVTDMVASEIRSLMPGGVVTAANRQLVVRSPMILGVVCGHLTGNRVAVQLSGGLGSVDTEEAGGVALLDTLSGTWQYRNTAWSSTYQSGGTPANACFGNGADTVGAHGDFLQFRGFSGYFGSTPAVGSVVMFYRQVEYLFGTSEMDPVSTALFRGVGGEDAVEFATGMDVSAQFLYRTGGSSYATSVSGGNLLLIDGIRIEAQARRRPRTGATADVTFGWGVNVALRNGG